MMGCSCWNRELDLARVSKQLSAAEFDRAKAFRLSEDPATPEFAAEYEVKEPAQGWFRPVKSSLISAPEAIRAR
jgi:hypothetical protein